MLIVVVVRITVIMPAPIRPPSISYIADMTLLNSTNINTAIRYHDITLVAGLKSSVRLCIGLIGIHNKNQPCIAAGPADLMTCLLNIYDIM